MAQKKKDATWLYELIPIAITTVVGAILVNSVVGVVDVGFTGSSILGVLTLVVIFFGIDKMVGLFSEEYSTAEKVRRERDKMDNTDNLRVR